MDGLCYIIAQGDRGRFSVSLCGCQRDGSSDTFLEVSRRSREGSFSAMNQPVRVRHAPPDHVEFAGIHTDPSFAPEGTAIPKLAVRSDDRTAQTSGLSGCRSCSPHSLLRSGMIRFIRAAHSKWSGGACRTRAGWFMPLKGHPLEPSLSLKRCQKNRPLDTRRLSRRLTCAMI